MIRSCKVFLIQKKFFLILDYFSRFLMVAAIGGELEGRGLIAAQIAEDLSKCPNSGGSLQSISRK